LTKVKIKIYKIEKVVDVFIIDKQNFKYDFLIGLDIIKEFKLIQNEDLQITQKDDLNPQDKTIVEYKSIKEKTTNPGTTKPMDDRENILGWPESNCRFFSLKLFIQYFRQK